MAATEVTDPYSVLDDEDSTPVDVLAIAVVWVVVEASEVTDPNSVLEDGATLVDALVTGVV